MGQNTLSFALPQSMRAYINARVSTGHYGNTSEYIRDLVRKDQTDNAKMRLRALIEEGLASGSGTPWTASDRAEMMAVANGDVE
ncbi:MAG: type II toxin-antitoxin system ParD family antitoxin [Rhodoferax sp.]|nr:type II toxin-antitoxin system ParD family antitoxin [Betaproteobacteria bacterium]NCN98492.1 type II toxin-antitoxin system ParD family antitoxin [Rhodoferax sp.]OIP20370.1 MAG: CopG family transcriptional regulator [Comamonadaceae bacterium CG2_30_57_122]PIZ24021.1 MAG: type II toxin-antitoxin system ParD family antitoxin [Comamonadaceae bacterium CG_4_10_14_0_8_um_filter_57_29]PJC13050.1 MAG: type II toxin-antitoxin system ParD family antitoxin [Comamonadaceae bacterium CG_4_9_14_0_8_um_f